MWDIINFIRSQGIANGNQVSWFSLNVLKRKYKSAGGCLARALEYGHISIVGHVYVEGKLYNIYA